MPRTRPRFTGRLVLALVVAAGVLAVATAQLASINAAGSIAAGSSSRPTTGPTSGPPIAANSSLPTAPNGWSTLFSDTFTGAAGGRLDSRWHYDTGLGASLGIGEAETTTNSTSNVHTDGKGDLDITALDHNGDWTSGQIETNTSIGAPAGGELEVTASIRQPTGGLGYWASFWMVGPGQWPGTGEIDIMQDVNSLSRTSATLHCGTAPGGPCNEPSGIGSGLVPCPGCQSTFHTYTMILNRTSPGHETIAFYLDGHQYYQASEAQIGATSWQKAYDHDMSLLFNVAIGGSYPRNTCNCTAPDRTTQSGGTMSIAYVAAYTTSGST